MHRPAAFSLLLLMGVSLAAGAACAASLAGQVRDAGGAPVAGAMVSLSHGSPRHVVTVMTDDAGRYRTPELAGPSPWTLRVRKPLFRDADREGVEPPAQGGSRNDPILMRLPCPVIGRLSHTPYAGEGERVGERQIGSCSPVSLAVPAGQRCI